MPKSPLPVIFLTFANDPKGQPLDELRPEKDELQSVLTEYQNKGWGIVYSSEYTVPKKLIRDLNTFSEQLIIFHFSGHNEGNNLQFEDEEGNSVPFHESGLQAFLRPEKRLKLVFLNACATEEHLAALKALKIPALLVTRNEVEDVVAKNFSVAFYDSLVAGNTLKEAFEKALTTLPNENRNGEIYRDRKRKDSTSSTHKVLWELHVLDEGIHSWKLENEAPKPLPKILNNLPAEPQNFIGREKDLYYLENFLSDKKHVLIKGIAGIGKTTLVTKFVHKNFANYKHIVWVSVSREKDSEGFKSVTEALGNDTELLTELNIAAFTLAERTAAVLSRFRNLTGKNLLIIDNVNGSIEKIKEALSSLLGWHILLTSTEEINGFGTIQLKELSSEKAIELFYIHYTKGEEKLEDVKQLLAHVGYHTLAVDLFARLCQKYPTKNTQKIYRLLEERKLKKLGHKVNSPYRKGSIVIQDCLHTLFDLQKLSRKELKLLIQWSILPAHAISWEILKHIFKYDRRPKKLDFLSKCLSYYRKKRKTSSFGTNSTNPTKSNKKGLDTRK